MMAVATLTPNTAKTVGGKFIHLSATRVAGVRVAQGNSQSQHRSNADYLIIHS